MIKASEKEKIFLKWKKAVYPRHTFLILNNRIKLNCIISFRFLN